MDHYVCRGGCRGVANDGTETCQMTTCASYGKILEKCLCTDGNHDFADVQPNAYAMNEKMEELGVELGDKSQELEKPETATEA